MELKIILKRKKNDFLTITSFSCNPILALKDLILMSLATCRFTSACGILYNLLLEFQLVESSILS